MLTNQGILQCMIFNGIALTMIDPGVIYLTYDKHVTNAARAVDPKFTGIRKDTVFEYNGETLLTVVGEYSGKDALRKAYDELKVHVVSMAPLMKEYMYDMVNKLYVKYDNNLDLVKSNLVMFAVDNSHKPSVGALRLALAVFGANSIADVRTGVNQLVDDETTSSIEIFKVIDKGIDGGNDMWNEWLDDSAADNTLFTLEEYNRRHNEYGKTVDAKLAAEETKHEAAA